jgi:hypothetical protein
MDNSGVTPAGVRCDIDVPCARDLVSTDPEQQKRAKAKISGIMGCLADRLLRGLQFQYSSYSVDPAQAADKAEEYLANRLTREVNGESEPDQPRYSDLVIDGAEFERVADKFVRNAIRSLARRPTRGSGAEVCTMEDPRGCGVREVELRDQLEHLLRRCSPGEQRVLQAMIDTNLDKVAAALLLGIEVNSIDAVFTRLRKKFPAE